MNWTALALEFENLNATIAALEDEDAFPELGARWMEIRDTVLTMPAPHAQALLLKLKVYGLSHEGEDDPDWIMIMDDATKLFYKGRVM